MKTAVSIPDAIFEAAEILARRSGLARSQLYTRALQQLIEEDASASSLTEAVNAAIEGTDTAPDEFIRRAARTDLARSKW